MMINKIKRVIRNQTKSPTTNQKNIRSQIKNKLKKLIKKTKMIIKINLNQNQNL